MDINVSFDIIIRRASLRKYESEWYSKPASVASRCENLFLNLHRLCSTTNNLFCEDCETIFQVTASHSRSGRRAWLEWSLSRQMSDNTIVWWVWMTGSRRCRRLFSVLFSFRGTCQNTDMADNRLLISKVRRRAAFNFLWYFTRKEARDVYLRVQSAERNDSFNCHRTPASFTASLHKSSPCRRFKFAETEIIVVQQNFKKKFLIEN